MIDLAFIKRCEEFAKPLAEELYEKRRLKIDKWNKDNPEKLKECRKKYEKSEIGKIKRKGIIATRHKRIRDHCRDLSNDDLENIRMFYINCPKGYEVDHIYPISKGGKHHLTNLQYLTKYENRVKSNKIIISIDKHVN